MSQPLPPIIDKMALAGHKPKDKQPLTVHDYLAEQHAQNSPNNQLNELALDVELLKELNTWLCLIVTLAVVLNVALVMVVMYMLGGIR